MTELPMDLTELDDDMLAQLVVAAHAETHRRAVLASAEARADQVATDYLNARDGIIWIIADGEPVPSVLPAFRQPTGAHDAYPRGAAITSGGRVYRSIISANVWAPDTYPDGWEDLGPVDEATADGPEPEGVDPAPYEVGKSYQAGDLLTFEGAVYRVVQAHTSAAHWPPDAAHSLYSRE